MYKWQNVLCRRVSHARHVCLALRTRSQVIDVNVDVNCQNWPIMVYTRSWDTGMRYSKQCLRILIPVSPWPSRGFRKTFLIRFPNSWDPGTGEFFIAPCFSVLFWNCPFKFQVINRIKKSCGDINEVELAKLGVALLNCQSKSEGRQTYECTDEMVSQFNQSRKWLVKIEDESVRKAVSAANHSTRPWRIVLLKVAYYATSSARNFAKLCQN